MISTPPLIVVTFPSFLLPPSLVKELRNERQEKGGRFIFSPFLFKGGPRAVETAFFIRYIPRDILFEASFATDASYSLSLNRKKIFLKKSPDQYGHADFPNFHSLGSGSIENTFGFVGSRSCPKANLKISAGIHVPPFLLGSHHTSHHPPNLLIRN